jgi:signal transduction histidine kinase
MKKDKNITNIAIVGAGKGGEAILSDIVKIPGVKVKFICDLDPDAPGFKTARENNVKCLVGQCAGSALDDPEIDLIFEVTGREGLFEYLQENKHPNCSIVGAASAKVIFSLLNTQQKITTELRYYKTKLTKLVMERTDELEVVVSDLQEKIQELNAVNEQLQKINNEKTKYLLNATHQLKAPFAAIQSYVDLLLEGYIDSLSEDNLSVIKKIKLRCELLSKLILEMLELANLNSCIEENVNMEGHSITKIVNSVVKSFAGILEARNIEIKFEEYNGNDIIECNKEQIESLVQALIENAINYSYDNSEIKILLKGSSKLRVVLNIVDNGIGIEEKKLNAIFQEYYRTNNAVKKYKNGSGLGLSIARRIAQIHRADIIADSVLGKGSVFRVAFPLMK